MKIFLIGKNGQLAQEIIKESGKQRFKIFAFSKKELDIRNYYAINKAVEKKNPDFVINTSAYHVTSECELHPDKAFEVNVFAVKNLALICKKNNVKFVTYSTDYVFDGKKNRPYIEDDQPNPLQIYGLSKYAGEIVSLNYNPDGVVIRTCGVYGGSEGSPSKKGNFVLNILKEMKTKNRVEISADQIISPTYAVDLAKATLQLIKKKNTNGIYHLINEGYCSWAEFAKKIIDLKKINSRIIPIDRKGFFEINRPLFSALKNSRAAALGIQLPYWKDALEKYLQFLD